MAAPPADRPVSVTLAIISNFRLEPPQPPKLSVSATIAGAFLIVSRIVFGVVYKNDCPQQPNIPNYLLGMALVQLIMTTWVEFPWDLRRRRLHSQPGCLHLLLITVVGSCGFVLFLAGNVWVLSIYQPNYDPAAADGLYCDKTLYTFAFWNVVFENLVGLCALASWCNVLLCYALVEPLPPNRAFARQVWEAAV